MNISNFEQHIETKIIDRGFDYYEQDQVEGLEQVDAGEFSATVLGSEYYSVYIQLDNKFDIVRQTCSCPYDWGDYCKHAVAVLYYIKDSEMHLQPINKSSKFSVLRRDLSKMSKKELNAMLLDMAKRNRDFADELLLYLGHDDLVSTND